LGIAKKVDFRLRRSAELRRVATVLEDGKLDIGASTPTSNCMPGLLVDLVQNVVPSMVCRAADPEATFTRDQKQEDTPVIGGSGCLSRWNRHRAV